VTTDSAVQIIAQLLMMAFWLSAPLLIIGFGIGLIVNVIQIATSLQDSAFSTVPRLAAFLFGLLLLLPWMMKKMIAYTSALFGDLSRYAQ
jgi:flagellar biosynthetic protein FliQ